MSRIERAGGGGGGGGGGRGGRGVPPRPDYSKSPKAKAREARRDPLVYIYEYYNASMNK